MQSTMYGNKYQTMSGLTTVYATPIATESGYRADNANIEPSTSAASEVKTVFFTPEGIYRQMTISDFIRSNRIPINQPVCPVSNTLVRVSFLKVPLRTEEERAAAAAPPGRDHVERLCFNVGREVYVYDYGGVTADPECSKAIDKRVYKGTFPTCHDFNVAAATFESSPLIVGFTAGQIQFFDPYRKDGQSRLYNEDRSIDKTPVTHLRWIPGQPSLFMASHSSGSIYVYNDEHAWLPTPPVYHLLKQGDGFSVHTVKSKTPRNPVARWTIHPASEGAPMAVNQFEFWPPASGGDGKSADDGTVAAKYLATAGQDGYLRVYDYTAMEPVGVMRSYFGGLLCLAWSTDGRLLAAGGEDDMINVYSLTERRVLCRGQGHKSWVSQVAFDPLTSICVGPTALSSIGLSHPTVIHKISEEKEEDGAEANAPTGGTAKNTAGDHQGIIDRSVKWSPKAVSENSTPPRNAMVESSAFAKTVIATESSGTRVNHLNGSLSAFAAADSRRLSSQSDGAGGSPFRHAATDDEAPPPPRNSYRLGSVGYDTQLCLWELSEDLTNSGDCCQVTLTNGLSSASANDDELLTVGDVDEHQATTSTEPRPPGSRTMVLGVGMTSRVPSGDAGQLPQSDSAMVDTTPLTVARTDSTKSSSKFRKLHRRGRSFGSRLGDRLRGTPPASSPTSAASASLSTTSTGGASLRQGADSTSSASGGGGDMPRLPVALGSPQCPRMNDVPLIEPLVCKKIAKERLTVLQFRDDCVITACQEGTVLTWARPDKERSLSSNNSKTRYYSTSSANATDYEWS